MLKDEFLGVDDFSIKGDEDAVEEAAAEEDNEDAAADDKELDVLGEWSDILSDYREPSVHFKRRVQELGNLSKAQFSSVANHVRATESISLEELSALPECLRDAFQQIQDGAMFSIAVR